LSEIYLAAPSESSSRELPFDVGEYIQLLLRRWRIVLAVCTLGIAVGVLHYSLTPRLYRASATIQIEQRTMFPVDSNTNPWLAAWASAKYYPTQYRLLQSRGLAERVVRDLRLMDDPAFDPSGAGFAPGEASASGDELRVAHLANRILGGTSIDPIDGTELVTISYVTSDPELAAKIANGVVQSFIDRGIDTRSERVGRTSRFIDDEIEGLRQQIRDTEEQLQDLSRNTNLITMDPDTNLTLQRLSNLNNDLATAQIERIEKESRFNELDLTRKERIAEQGSLGLVSELRRELLRMESDYESRLQVYKPDWPDMIDLKAAIEERRRLLDRQVDKSFNEVREQRSAELQSARSREQRLIAEINKVKSEALDLGQASVEYNYLSREVSARKGLLDQLLREQSETGMSARLSRERESNVHIVESALVPRSPFRPSLRLDLSLGLAAGLMLGVSLVLLTHLLDRTVKTPEELEALTGLPLLAVIPDIGFSGTGYGYRSYSSYGSRRSGSKATGSDTEDVSSIELIPALKPRLAVSEAYRSLRTALLLSSAEQLGVVTVTSAESGEGKTATAANLAVVMSQLGKKVLLVDADLRKPRLHKIFGSSNRSGLVNHLTSGASTDELFIASGQDNLTFCPAGPHPPNPSELLASERMRQFLEDARRDFDFVIVDTPPVLAVTDAALPGSIGDGVVLCFRAHNVLRADVKSCCDRLRLADVRMLGTVLNRHQPRRAGGYGRKYHYYETYSEEIANEISDSAA